MGFMAGFAEVVVDQYNKNQEQKNDESKIALQARMEQLGKEKAAYETRVTKQKEAYQQAQDLGSILGDTDPASINQFAGLLYNGTMSADQIREAHANGQLQRQQTEKTVAIPNSELPANQRLDTAAETPTETGTNVPVPDAVSMKPNNPVEAVVSGVKKVVNNITGKVEPVTGRDKEKTDPLLDRTDAKIKKIAPHLLSRDEEEDISKKFTSSNGPYKFLPKTKEYKIPSWNELANNIAVAMASGDPNKIAQAESDIRIANDAVYLEAKAKAAVESGVPELPELYDEKRNIEKALKKDPQNPELLEQYETVNARVGDAERIMNSKNKGAQVGQGYMILKKNEDGTYTYTHQVSGKEDADGQIRNMNAEGQPIITAPRIPVTDDQRKRLVEYSAQYGDGAKEYNKKVSEYSATIVASAQLMAHVETFPQSPYTVSALAANVKSFFEEAEGAVNLLEMQGIDPKTAQDMSDLANHEKLGLTNEQVKEKAESLKYKLGNFLASGVKDQAIASRVYDSLKLSVVYSLAAADGQAGNAFSDKDAVKYEAMVAGKDPIVIAKNIGGLLSRQKAALMTTQGEFNKTGGGLAVSMLEKELSYNGQKIDLGLKIERVDNIITKNIPLYSNDPKIQGYIKLLNSGATGVEPAATSQIPRISTKTEYDQLPSGTEYLREVNGKTVKMRKK